MTATVMSKLLLNGASINSLIGKRNESILVLYERSQNDRVKAKLDRDGYVSRNECVRQFPAILRLSARIQDLEEEGYIFEAKEERGDYVYVLVCKPAPKTVAMRL
jgi:hypothetical protein